jgi:hypothetical protein
MPEMPGISGFQISKVFGGIKPDLPLLNLPAALHMPLKCHVIMRFYSIQNIIYLAYYD